MLNHVEKKETRVCVSHNKLQIPLAMVSEGTECQVEEIRGGRGIMRRLQELGFTTNEKIKVLHTNPPGPILVEVKDSRVAIGRGIGMKIIISVPER